MKTVKSILLCLMASLLGVMRIGAQEFEGRHTLTMV